MKRLMGLAMVLGLFVMPMVGCGVKELGPVDENKVEMMSEDDMKKKMEENMKKMSEMGGGKYDPGQATGGGETK